MRSFARLYGAVLAPVALAGGTLLATMGFRSDPVVDGAESMKPVGMPVIHCFAEGTPDDVVAYYNNLLHTAQPPVGQNYYINGSWTSPPGTPASLSWSLVPDGLTITGGIGEPSAPSNMFSTMDARVARATWVAKFQQVFDRWSALTHVTYTRVTNGTNDWDDGVAWGTGGNDTTHGDIRIGMHFLDGLNGILAYNFFPTTSDMVLDSGDVNNWAASGTDYLFLRNVVAHEHGHGLGFLHVCPSSQTKLMEPFISLAYDGPRHDDIRAAAHNYGDIYETNDTTATSTDLGTLTSGTLVTIGTVPLPSVGSSTGLLSLDNPGDVDFYKFNINFSGSVSVTIIPKGLSYDSSTQSGTGGCNSGNTIDSLRMANLDVQVIDKNGTTVLGTAAVQPAGGTEALVNVGLSGTGTYFIKVYAEGTQVESQLYLMTVIASGCTPPVLTGQPQSQSVRVGDFVQMSVNITNPNSYSFQWAKDGVNLTDTATISGTQSRFLEIDPVALVDAGDYTCRVTEIASGCAVVSNPATLSVTDCVMFTTQPLSSQIICQNDPASLTVAVAANNVTYQWRRGLTNLTDNSNITGTQTPTLSILSTQPADAATDYNCLVSDLDLGCASASNNANITVATPAVITQNPVSQTANVGDFVEFSVNVSGGQFNYSYQWRRNGVNLTNGGNISGADARFLDIDPVGAGDAGQYDCVVTFIASGCMKTSTAATLTVNGGGTCTGDLDANGAIDLVDLSILLSNYGSTSAGAEDGDLDGDSDVDLTDLAAILALYGTSCP